MDIVFKKNYPLRLTAARTLGVGERTFDKYVWYGIKLISEIDNVSKRSQANFIILYSDILNIFMQIQFKDRFKGRLIGQNNYVSLDGTDFSIYDKKPFDSKWYSFKLNRAGIRYEVGICIATGFIVWFFGGYKAGKFNDLQLAREEFTSMLLPGEKAIADKGYNDSRYFVNPRTLFLNRRQMKNIMARHENVNQRIKSFQCMRQMFRHGWKRHNLCFEAVIKLVQIKLLNGEPLAAICIAQKKYFRLKDVQRVR